MQFVFSDKSARKVGNNNDRTVNTDFQKTYQAIVQKRNSSRLPNFSLFAIDVVFQAMLVQPQPPLRSLINYPII